MSPPCGGKLCNLHETPRYRKLPVLKPMLKRMSTVAFTLPVSCQICLGKVKQPVVCPNLHVFCGHCMDLWLQRNQQCPACRVPISGGTPCRQVLGGLSHQSDNEDNFSNKELRRCRMELIYKEYETELDKLTRELEDVKSENKELWVKVNEHEAKKGKTKCSPTKPDMSMISSINARLKGATQLYDNIKGDMKIVKKENNRIREDADNVKRENQTLRMELSSRSPRKFGRYTVATLESKVESCEKEINQLQRALEKSDQYISEMENEVKTYQEIGCKFCQGKLSRKTNDVDMEFGHSRLDDSELPSRISNITGESLDLRQTTSVNHTGEESFRLDMPSPMTTCTAVSSFSNRDTEKDSFLLPKPSPYREDTIDSAKKKLRFSVPNELGGEYLIGGEAYRAGAGESTAANSAARNLGSNSQPEPRDNNIPAPSRLVSSNLNISITPEMEDCLRLMDQAERRCKDSSPPQRTYNAILPVPRQNSFGQETVSSYTRGLITASDTLPVPSSSVRHPASESIIPRTLAENHDMATTSSNFWQNSVPGLSGAPLRVEARPSLPIEQIPTRTRNVHDSKANH